MKAILWDFDGTLAFRNGLWTGAMTTLANRMFPERKLARDEVRPLMKKSFPWDAPSAPHVGQTSDEWWSAMNAIFEKVYIELGYDPLVAKDLAAHVKDEFLDLKEWHVFEDVIPCLTSLQKHGWEHFILSNHVPELVPLIEALGLSSFFSSVSTSGLTGYEKPNPKAFTDFLSQLPRDSNVWMIGDNIVADVQGAEAIGLPAILVRKKSDTAQYYCESLSEVEAILNSQ